MTRQYGHVKTPEYNDTLRQYGVVGEKGRGLWVNQNALSCCGATTLQTFNGFICYGFAEQAAWLAGLYKLYGRTQRLFFVLNEAQNNVKASDYNAASTDGKTEQEMLRDCGAVVIQEFPNLNTHGNTLYIYSINMRDGVGKFFDEDGVPFNEEPK